MDIGLGILKIHDWQNSTIRKERSLKWAIGKKEKKIEDLEKMKTIRNEWRMSGGQGEIFLFLVSLLSRLDLALR